MWDKYYENIPIVSCYVYYDKHYENIFHVVHSKLWFFSTFSQTTPEYGAKQSISHKCMFIRTNPSSNKSLVVLASPIP